MKVLAVGAAGSSAGLVVRALSDKGVTVRGLVHSPGAIATAVDNGATETFVADLMDRDALRDAVRGVDGIFHIIPAFVPDEAGAGVTLVEVAAEEKIGRFVFSSVYHPSLADLSNHREKLPAEAALYNSNMDFTVLQPAMFMSQLAGIVKQAQGGDTISGPYSEQSQMTYVAYEDVAEVAALSFTTDRFVNGTFELAAAGTYSREDLAQLLSTLLGRSIAAGSDAIDEVARHLPPSQRDGLTRMFTHYDEHGFRGGNSLVLETMLGRAPVSVPDFLARLVG